MKDQLYVVTIGILLLTGLLSVTTPARQAQGHEVRTLAPGQPLRREIRFSEEHEYQITLAAGEFAQVIIRPRGIDPEVNIFAPDGAKSDSTIISNFEGGTSVIWEGDEWARGAYSILKPGEMFSLLPHVARAEGRVHFAGEHTSAWPGWMQGALESGNRVAREVSSTE